LFQLTLPLMAATLAVDCDTLVSNSAGVIAPLCPLLWVLPVFPL
jgi:hypothetical protein